MKLTFKTLASKIMAFLSPRVIQAQTPIINGAMVDQPSLGVTLAQLASNGMPVSGAVNYSSVAGATLTLTALGAAVVLLTAGSAVTVTLDSAYNIVNNLPTPAAVGQKFTFDIVTAASTTVATPTLSDTAVTLAGTTSVLAAAKRSYQGVITQLTTTSAVQTTAGTSFTSLTQVGSTNNYTVALGTNAIVPTVGQVIYLAVSTGTLPSGWYPINKVSSATSFVIAAPASSAAWTATVASVGTALVAPATYSPLVTITGMYSTVTATMSS